MQPLQAGSVSDEMTELFWGQGVWTILKTSIAKRQDHFLFFPTSMGMSQGLVHLIENRVDDGLYRGRG